MSTSESYFALSAELPEAASELAQWLLHERGSLGLEIRDSSVRAMPGQPPLPGGRVHLVGFFAARAAAEQAREELRRSLPEATLGLSEALCEDWSESWKSQVRSSQVGRIWVGPPWRTADAAPNSLRILIEPKMAFGTGDHPSTQLCLQVLDKYLTKQPGLSVLDVGTGSGVLAIAARMLGAGRVRAVDNDATAVALAAENCVLNHVGQIDLSTAPLESITETFDIIVANIFANVLIKLAPHFRKIVRKHLVVAGILVEQAADVEAAYRDRGFGPARTVTRGDWVRLELEPQ